MPVFRPVGPVLSAQVGASKASAAWVSLLECPSALKGAVHGAVPARSIRTFRIALFCGEVSSWMVPERPFRQRRDGLFRLDFVVPAMGAAPLPWYHHGLRERSFQDRKTRRFGRSRSRETSGSRKSPRQKSHDFRYEFRRNTRKIRQCRNPSRRCLKGPFTCLRCGFAMVDV